MLITNKYEKRVGETPYLKEGNKKKISSLALVLGQPGSTRSLHRSVF